MNLKATVILFSYEKKFLNSVWKFSLYYPTQEKLVLFKYIFFFLPQHFGGFTLEVEAFFFFLVGPISANSKRNNSIIDGLWRRSWVRKNRKLIAINNITLKLWGFYLFSKSFLKNHVKVFPYCENNYYWHSIIQLPIVWNHYWLSVWNSWSNIKRTTPGYFIKWVILLVAYLWNVGSAITELCAMNLVICEISAATIPQSSQLLSAFNYSQKALS